VGPNKNVPSGWSADYAADRLLQLRGGLLTRLMLRAIIISRPHV
jgi:hypothetical protein